MLQRRTPFWMPESLTAFPEKLMITLQRQYARGKNKDLVVTIFLGNKADDGKERVVFCIFFIVTEFLSRSPLFFYTGKTKEQKALSIIILFL